ncbi:MAG: flippase-like domain-containing protein [Candidatus Diapherotrites archaeon]|uniref:Flippase-like domain-containing protein n=1 Tax=Candidatus Iainarchaeum sp. TaxID=3101447 RepID=A0A7J4JVX8_9ARCH|nr:flippase-like domain-containing protein [Candidatus Diapherotrites archaeon]HIH21120.1 flippase-like domain-containing protein [Candidatus Diapherotrites archaeon]HIH32812.1 flippase-like domain-containing protein [Candidatus Diapherotrites archaeon]
MKKIILPVLGIIVLGILLTQVNLQEVLNQLQKARPEFLLAAAILSFVTAFVKSLKWKQIVEATGHKISNVKAFKAFSIGFALSLASPGRIGDFARALFIKDRKRGLASGLATVVIDRIIDIILLFCLAAIGLLVIAEKFQNQGFEIAILAAILLSIALSVMLFSREKARIVLKPFFRLIIPERFKGRAKSFFNEFYKALKSFAKNKEKVAKSIILGLLSWALTIAFALLIAQGVQLNADLIFIAACIPILLIVETIPISIAGIGTRDATAVFLFSFAGISPEKSISFSLLFLFFGYLILGFFGAVLSFKEKIRA